MKKILSIIIVLIFTIAGFSFAKDKALEITSRVNKEEVYIGDRIEVNVIAENAGRAELLFTETPDTGEFSLLTSSPVKAGWPSKKVVGREYIMSIYTTGTHVIPPIPVQHKEAGAADWNVSESPQIPIKVLSLLTGNEKDIKDIKGLSGIKGNPGRLILIFFTALLLLGFVAFIWLRHKLILEEEKRKKRPPHVVAYEELAELKEEDLPKKGMTKEYYSRLSDIARHYLENRFLYRAPEMTTEEFLTSIESAKELNAEQKKLLKNFLSHCDMVKFAKYGPTLLEILDSYKSAEELVDQTKEEVEEDGGTE